MMKKLQFLFFMTVISLFLAGCSSDDDNVITPQPEDNARYYVKYEAYMPLGWSDKYSSRIITFVTEKGEQSLDIPNSKWEGTYGPLKKGTRLYIKVKAVSGGIRLDTEYYVRISVSRDKEPFVIKAEQRAMEVNSLSANYVIDF